MTNTDPLARERFRTILAEATEPVDNTDWAGVSSDIAECVMNEMPGAHFEYRTNDAGVRMRRVVVESEWEIDPSLTAKNEQDRYCPDCGTTGVPADHLCTLV